jgi:curved DNA-binding protein CbpA
MDAVDRALETLGLGPDATPEHIKEAYRELVTGG